MGEVTGPTAVFKDPHLLVDFNFHSRASESTTTHASLAALIAAMAAASVSLPPAAADFSQKASRRARASALSGASGMVGAGVGGRVTTCKSEPKKYQKKGAPPRYYTVLVQIQRSKFNKQAWRQCAEQLVRCTLLARARCQSRETRESRWVRWERRLFTPPSTMLGE